MADSIPQPIVVLVTFPSAEEANRAAAALVDEHIAACVNLVKGVQSVFFWQNVREEAIEVLAIIKTTQERFADLSARVKSLHSYSVPEIIALPIVAGSEPYLRWVEDSVSNR